MEVGTPQRSALLAGVPLFAGLPDGALRELEGALEPRVVRAGEWLFREGEDSDRLCVVRSGRLRVVVESGEVAMVARVVGPGSMLGELGVLTGSPRSASVQAVRDSELLELGAAEFDSLLARSHGLAVRLARQLAVQLQASGGLDLPEAPAAIVAVVPTHASLPIEGFCDALQRTFAGWGPVAVLDGRKADAEARDSRYGHVVDRLEREHEHVLLVATPGLHGEEWNRFCMRQADRVLVLTDGRAPADLPVADLLGCDLVFLGPVSGASIRPWLRALEPRAHHLVGTGSALSGDVARAARRVTRRSLGVVLSGGGARGFAHIGVLDVLAHEGLEVDRVGGCSIGAFVGAMAALGFDAEHMRTLCRQEFVSRSPFNDYTVPRVSLIRSRKAAAMLSRIFAEIQLEELPRPLFTVSADLLSSQLVVHRDGPLREAVAASMCLPGLAPPLATAGRLLVDGGVLNNLPVDLMAERGEGPILASDVIRRLSPREAADSSLPALPSLVETLSRATVLGSVERAESNRALAQLVVTPDVQDIPLRDFTQLDRAIEAGRRAAEQTLAGGGKEILLALIRGESRHAD